MFFGVRGIASLNNSSSDSGSSGNSQPLARSINDFIPDDASFRITFPTQAGTQTSSKIKVRADDDASSVVTPYAGETITLTWVDGNPDDTDSILNGNPDCGTLFGAPAGVTTRDTVVGNRDATECEWVNSNGAHVIGQYFIDSDRLYAIEDVGPSHQSSWTLHLPGDLEIY